MDKSTNIDLCRGMLFVLMANTHASSVSHLPADSWLLSDLWLPTGWATVTFVVLSGYSVGFITSRRSPNAAWDRALYRRAKQILAVMLVSNAIFAILREAVAGRMEAVHTAPWWFGFLTLQTPWTISGVLLPTALLLLCAPELQRRFRFSCWQLLFYMIGARALVAVLSIEVAESPLAASWAARFFLLEGFGGFPVLPFVLNGCIGIALGMLRNHSEWQWQRVTLVLMGLQVGIYLTSYYPTSFASAMVVATFGAAGKFAWMYFLAHILKLSRLRWLADPVELIGKFALGSFVMHRFFLHALAEALVPARLPYLPPEMRMATLLLCTLLLTWSLCRMRQHTNWIDTPFRRLAL
jgi:hypothetical protein